MTYADELRAAALDMHAPRADDAPTVISTFAGGGGSSMGYHMAGFRELMAVEWDKHACKCLRENFPHVDVWEGDIGELSVAEVFRRTGLERGQLNVFDGSPPCQGFSTAGKRRYVDDRNVLFKHFVRLLDGLQPKVFVMENVAGMVKGDMRVMFAEILNDLRAVGYDVKAWVLNAKHYGAPQSRQRLIFVGARSDLGKTPTPPLQTHADPKILLGNRVVPRGYLPVVTMGEAIGISHDPFFTDGVDAGKRVPHDEPSPTVLRSAIGKVFKSSFCVAVDGWSAGARHYLDRPAPTLTKSGVSKASAGQYALVIGGYHNGKVMPLSGPSPTVMKGGIAGVSMVQVGIMQGERDLPDDHRPWEILPALPVPRHDEKVAAIFGPGTGIQVRRLAVGEVMRLQSFPDDYKWPEGTSWSDGWGRVGNSVPPLMMRAIAKHIRETLL